MFLPAKAGEPKRLYPKADVAGNLAVTDIPSGGLSSPQFSQPFQGAAGIALSTVWTKFVTPKSVIAATIVVSLVGAGAIVSIGADSYVHSREQAQIAMESAKRSALRSDVTAAETIAQAGAAISAGDAVLASSEGKTLDNTARAELSETLDTAKQQLQELTVQSTRIDDKLATAELAFNEQLLWPPAAEATAHRLHDSIGDLSGPLLATLTKLAKQSDAVTAAQAAWQAEQERIAAESAAKAAAERAAARAVRSGGTSNPSSGSTAPNVIAAPPAPAAPTGWSPESFLLQYLSPSEFTLGWNESLCSPGYICGTTQFSSPPLITLFGSAATPANYDFGGGRYVLVHEAAHVKQYWFYTSGPGNYQDLLAVAPPPPSNWTRPAEYWPLEFMADCSTMVQIGWAPTYAKSSCNPDQLAEAAKVW